MTSIDQEFQNRVSRIPLHGLGLSVDVYTPDLLELLEALKSRHLDYGYLELFKASQSALADVRRRLPQAFLEYHAEGLWLTQPALEMRYPFEMELIAAATHLSALGSYWINHECASKQMAGYSFGTYLPPLFTGLSADVTAQNAMLIQERLASAEYSSGSREPLLLVEVPPLTYFGFGDLSVPDFFRRIAAQVPCGLVLDIGHVWTIYRYSGEWRRRALHDFLADFLDEFPLERVVQIHVAGLEVHETTVGAVCGEQAANAPFPSPPLWIDAHGAPIPAVLMDMLAQVLSHPNVVHLKGIALEVDTKSVPLTVNEYETFQERFAGWANHALHIGASPEGDPACGYPPVIQSVTQERVCELSDQYALYAQIASGQTDIRFGNGLGLLGEETEGLDIYRRQYLPHEILEWGGALRDMFPRTCQYLDREGVPLSDFVAYWFREPRAIDGRYDFFLLKLDRFIEFIEATVPKAAEPGIREADALRQAYQMANERTSQAVMAMTEERRS
jgi:uncharacterized protein (UPF0276 family)